VGSHHILDADQLDPEKAETIALLRDLIGSCLTLTVPDGSLV